LFNYRKNRSDNDFTKDLLFTGDILKFSIPELI